MDGSIDFSMGESGCGTVWPVGRSRLPSLNDAKLDFSTQLVVEVEDSDSKPQDVCR